MSLEAFPGFTSYETQHCITGSMRHLYSFNHYPISEDMLLGLGAGVGFIYWHMKGSDPFCGGRANVGRSGEEGLEITAGRRTGVKVEVHQTSSAKKAETLLVETLLNQTPIMLYVDMGLLPYFDFPEEYHFGMHSVVVAGYDPDSRHVLIADRDGLHPVPLDALTKARSSKYKPFPPNNRWCAFDFTDKRPLQPAEIWMAIREVSTGMLHPPIANLGAKGIHTAAKRIHEWPKMMNEAELRHACFNGYIMIDAKGGTGGGLFRYMYARFLNEAAAITGETQLTALGEQMHTNGDRWQEIAALFKQAAEEPDPLPLLRTITGQLDGLADCEQQVWEQLAEIAAV